MKTIIKSFNSLIKNNMMIVAMLMLAIYSTKSFDILTIGILTVIYYIGFKFLKSTIVKFFKKWTAWNGGPHFHNKNNSIEKHAFFFYKNKSSFVKN